MDNSDFVTPLLERYSELSREVQGIDAKLNLDKKVYDTTLDQAIEAAGSTVIEFQEQLDKSLSQYSGIEQIAVLEIVRRAFKNNEEILNSWFKENKPAEQPKPNEIEQEAYRAERKKFVDMAQAIYNLISQVAPTQAETLDKLSHLRGGFGGKGVKRGKRIKGVVDYTVEGHKVEGHRLGDVKTKLEDFNVKVSVADIKAALIKAHPDFDYDAPPSTWAWSVDGKTIRATTVSNLDDEDEVDDEEYDEANEDVTTEEEIAAPEGSDNL